MENLRTLLRDMRPTLRDGVYAFASVAPGHGLPDATPIMLFQEAEGTTLILPLDAAERAGLDVAFPCRKITLQVHSALDAVGLIAAVTARLAAAGIAVNAVSAFHHDHLFVPAARAEEALALLLDLASEAGGEPEGAADGCPSPWQG